MVGSNRPTHQLQYFVGAILWTPVTADERSSLPRQARHSPRGWLHANDKPRPPYCNHNSHRRWPQTPTHNEHLARSLRHNSPSLHRRRRKRVDIRLRKQFCPERLMHLWPRRPGSERPRHDNVGIRGRLLHFHSLSRTPHRSTRSPMEQVVKKFLGEVNRQSEL